MLVYPGTLMSVLLASTALTPAEPFRLSQAGLDVVGFPYGPLAAASGLGIEIVTAEPIGPGAASGLGITIIAHEAIE